MTKLRFTIGHPDFFTRTLAFAWPKANTARRLDAAVTVTQPYGFSLTLKTRAVRSGDTGEIQLDYPLLDEGRFASRPSKDAEGRAPWGMGVYRFEIRLTSAKKSIASGVLNLDPNTFFGKIGGMRLAQVDSLHQFIECAPTRPAFIDTSKLAFTIRTLSSRVKTCDVEIDIVRPRKPDVLIDPIRLSLTGRTRRFTIDATGWARGEYWLRVRLRRKNKLVGPYLVRQVYVETPHIAARPQNPLRIGHAPQYLVDDWVFSTSTGLKHEPDQLELVSDGPIAHIDQPWEQGPDHLPLESFSYDEKAGQFHALYHAGPLSQDKRLWEMGVRSTLTAFSTRYLCLAVSSDGVRWDKPDLGLIEFNGSKKNNILRDKAREGYLLSGEFDSFPVPVKERPIPRKYRYRYYDPKTDGPIDMDNFVFRVFLGESMEPDDQFEGDFRPKHREFWGLERRGDTFLALTRRPVLQGARGMQLQYTNERASSYPFEGDPMALYQPNGRSTCTYYHRKSKTFYYYYRPDYPAYPPNGLPFYLWHKVAAIRTRAVLWTQDGIHWNRRYMTMPDEHDPPGTTLYGFGFLKPEGREVSDTDDQLYLGALLNWDLTTQRHRQHLMWSRDLVNWDKFGSNRKPILEPGPVGSWNAGTSGLSHYQPVTNTDGQEEWFFTFTGTSCRYMLGGGRECASLEEYKAQFPYHAMAPFFTTWEELYKEATTSRVLTGVAKCKAGRLAHVEPSKKRGEFTTLPIVAEGSRLLINACCEAGGAIRVEVQDAEGNPLPELGIDDAVVVKGDRVDHEVRWKRARFEEVNRRVVRLRFALVGAKLYSFRVDS